MKQNNIKRRNFLLGLGLGGVSAAAALLAGKSASVPEAETAVTETPQASKGYRLSEHVQTYYRKARL
jgi:hypothetical protein